MKKSLTNLLRVKPVTLKAVMLCAVIVLNICISPYSSQASALSLGSQKSTLVHKRSEPITKRLSGASSIDTSIAVSKKYFSAPASVAYIVNKTAYADGIIAGSMRASGPILYVNTSSLPSSIAAELQRLKPQKVIVIGGVSVVSDGVMRAIEQKVPATSSVERISGPSRYATAISVSQADYPLGSNSVYISNSTAYPDSIVGTQQNVSAPLLYVSKDTAQVSTTNEIKRLKAKEVIIIGDSEVVSDATADVIAQRTGVTIKRVGGPNRNDTAVAISKELFPSGSKELFIANGMAIADGILIGSIPVKAPLLYVKTTIPESVMTEIQRLGASSATFIGGTSVLPESVIAKTKQIMNGSQVLHRVSEGISYYALAHPDDELASWAVTDASAYTVFILTTQGESTTYCKNFGGKGSAECREKRLSSWHQYLNNYYAVTDYGMQTGGYRLYKGQDSARLIFDYGDGSLTPAEVTQAIDIARTIDYGISTENYIAGGNYWDPERDPDCSAKISDSICGLYDHPDHRAVYQAIANYPHPNKVTFHGRYNPTVNAGVTMGKDVFDSMIACPTGTYNQAYAWLHPPCWTPSNSRWSHWEWMREY